MGLKLSFPLSAIGFRSYGQPFLDPGVIFHCLLVGCYVWVLLKLCRCLHILRERQTNRKGKITPRDLKQDGDNHSNIIMFLVCINFKTKTKLNSRRLQRRNLICWLTEVFQTWPIFPGVADPYISVSVLPAIFTQIACMCTSPNVCLIRIQT